MLFANAASGQTPASTYTPYPTYTPLPTYTPYPTVTPLPTVTPTPRPSLPPELTAPTMIAIVDAWQAGGQYVHGSGQFSVADLPSWDRRQRGVFGDAHVVFSNVQMFSFVDISVTLWDENGDKTVRDWLQPQDLWGNYEFWQELDFREREKWVIVDYALSFRGLPFLGRIVLMPTENYIGIITIVVPANAYRLLYLFEKLITPTLDIRQEAP